MPRLSLLLLLAAAPIALPAQANDAKALRAQVRAYRTAHEAQILTELRELLAIPNVASDRANIARNADHIVAMLERRGVRARLLEGGEGPPAVYGELLVPGARRTVMWYAHYDGQPVDTTQWTTPPWTPVLRDRALDAGGKEIPFPTGSGTVDPEARIYARSASDDKSPIIAMLTALDALRDAGRQPTVNLKFFFEGEEEAGSAHLRPVLEQNLELLRADVWLFCDGPVHQTRRPQVVFGVRGTTDLEMTVYGPTRALHSGHYGNWAPNPLVLLTRLLATMRDEDGRITIAGFYDDVKPITPAERRALRSVPNADSALRSSLGLAASEARNAPLVERIMLPALNLRGIEGGHVGALAANAVPVEARASIDFRLVPNETPARIRRLVERHVTAQGYHIVHAAPTPAERTRYPRIIRLDWGDGYAATRTSMSLPISRDLLRVVEEPLDEPLIAMPSLGGSLPMYTFQEVLRAPLIVLPMVNHDNNQHAFNENLRIQNLWDGIEMYAGVMARLGSVMQ
jgi:acetylornithine deacetylase/succinyl-diaminopimelate desuccinylase-like protein